MPHRPAPRPRHDERAPPSNARKFCKECVLFAEAVLFGQNNDTAALPEGSVSGALNTGERCPTCPLIPLNPSEMLHPDLGSGIRLLVMPKQYCLLSHLVKGRNECQWGGGVQGEAPLIPVPYQVSRPTSGLVLLYSGGAASGVLVHGLGSTSEGRFGHRRWPASALGCPVIKTTSQWGSVSLPVGPKYPEPRGGMP